MVQRCGVQKYVFALSVTTCLVGLDLAYANSPEDMSDTLMMSKGVLLSRRYRPPSPKISPFFEKGRFPQRQFIIPKKNLLMPIHSSRLSAFIERKRLVKALPTLQKRSVLFRSRFKDLIERKKAAHPFQSPTTQPRSVLPKSRLKDLIQRKSAAQPLQLPTIQERSALPRRRLKSFIQRKILGQVVQFPPHQRNSSIAASRPRLSFLEKKPLTYQTPSPKKRVVLRAVPKVPLAIVERNSISPPLSSAIRLPDLVDKVVVLGGVSAPSPQPIELRRYVETATLDPTIAIQLRTLEASVTELSRALASMRNERINSNASSISQSSSVLPSSIRLPDLSDRPLTQSSLSSVLPPQGSMMDSRRSVETHPLDSNPMQLRSLGATENDLRRGPSSVRDALVSPIGSSISLSLSPSVLPGEIRLPDLSQQNRSSSPSLLMDSRERVEDSHLRVAVSPDERLRNAEESMNGLTHGFYEISSQLFDGHGSENLRLQQGNLESLKKRSIEFKEHLYSLDPVVNEEFRSEKARPRAERLMSRLSDHLGWLDALEFKINRLLRPSSSALSMSSRRVSPQNDSERASPSLQVATIERPSSQLSTDGMEDSLNDQLRNLEEAVYTLRSGRSSIDQDLYGNHTVENLRLQEERLSSLQETARKLELRLLSLDSEVPKDLQSQQRVQINTVLHSFGENLCSLRDVRSRLTFLKSRTSDNSVPSAENRLHLVIRLRAPSSELSPAIPPEETLRSSEEFIYGLQYNIGNIAYDLFGNHSEENLSFQQEELRRLKEKTNRIEAGVPSLRFGPSQGAEVGRVKDLMICLNELDCMFDQVGKRIESLKSPSSGIILASRRASTPLNPSSELSTDDSLEKQLKKLGEDIDDLNREGGSINSDLYDDQREPNLLKGHGAASLRLQGERLARLQETSSRIASRLTSLNSGEGLNFSSLIGSFNETIHSLREVQSRLNFIKSRNSVSSLETEDPFFSFMPHFGETNLSRLSTDFTPEDEMISLKKSNTSLKSDLSELQETLFGEHTLESLRLPEANFLKLKKAASEVESHLMFLDSQITRDWQSPQRKKINELMYSFVETLCFVRQIEGRIHSLKSPPPPVIPVAEEVRASIEEAPSEPKSLDKALSQIKDKLWSIDGGLYVDHARQNLDFQGEELAQAKRMLSDLEPRLTLLDSQTTRDLQSEQRGVVNSLLEALSQNQCFIRDVEKRFKHLNSRLPVDMVPVVHLSSVNTVFAPSLETEEREGMPSSVLSTEPSLDERLKSSEKVIKDLDDKLRNILNNFGSSSEENLNLREQELVRLMREADEVESGLLHLRSNFSQDDEQAKVTQVLTLFDNIDSRIGKVQGRINTLRT